MASGQRTPRTRTTRTQPNIRPVYETFTPKSEMKENEDAYFLHIHLPGFTKERIKINFVRSSRVVRVVGERPIGGNRISNFEETYTVPENIEVEKLQGKYEQGTLIITMPKIKPISQVSPKVPLETTQNKGPTPISPSKNPMLEPKPFKEVAKETMETTRKIRPTPISPSNKLVPQPKPLGPTPVSPSKQSMPEPKLKEVAMPPKSPITRMEQREKSNGDRKGPQHVQEETMLKSTAIAATPQKDTSQKGQQEIETYIRKVKDKLHEKDEKKSGIKPEKYIDHNEVLDGREIRTRPKTGSTAPIAQEKKKETRNIDKGKSKEDEFYSVGKGIKEVVASASEVVAKIGEGKLNDEEKPLVANMGAAFLVIVALGAYVTYKFTSSSKA